MLTIYKTDDSVIRKLSSYEDGAWVNLAHPSKEELTKVSERFEIELDDLASALDEEETSRLSLENGYTLILVDIPAPEVRHQKKMYTTLPLGIILKQNVIITVCREETPVIAPFLTGKIKDFSTKKKMRFVYQILLRASMLYQSYLRAIDQKRVEIEGRASASMEYNRGAEDIIELHELESTLVYFMTSLKANSTVIDRFKRYKRIEQYPEDMELLDDVLIEYKQAIEMSQIYRDIVDGARDLLSAIADSRLNNAMKYLTSITVVMTIPTIISGIYGMNVSGKWMPFAETAHGFSIVCGIIVLVCFVTLVFLRKKKML